MPWVSGPAIPIRITMKIFWRCVVTQPGAPPRSAVAAPRKTVQWTQFAQHCCRIRVTVGHLARNNTATCFVEKTWKRPRFLHQRILARFQPQKTWPSYQWYHWIICWYYSQHFSFPFHSKYPLLPQFFELTFEMFQKEAENPNSVNSCLSFTTKSTIVDSMVEIKQLPKLFWPFIVLFHSKYHHLPWFFFEFTFGKFHFKI